MQNSTSLLSNHAILWSDETWLPEWSGNLGGGVEQGFSQVTSGRAGQNSCGISPESACEFLHVSAVSLSFRPELRENKGVEFGGWIC